MFFSLIRLFIHIGWVFIARGGKHPLTMGSTPCVTGKNNFFVSKEKYLLGHSKMKNNSFNRKYSSCDTHAQSTPCKSRKISCHMIKYTRVTRKPFCDRNNISCYKRSIISVTEGIFPVKVRIFSVTGIKRTPCLTIQFSYEWKNNCCYRK